MTVAKMLQASDIAYNHIRNAIIEGDFPQGERLTEEALVAFCNVSRTPVRDALQRLDFEGYVVSRKNKGVWVRPWSLEDVRAAYQARALIESFNAAEAARRITPQIIAQLEHLVQDMEQKLATHADNVAHNAGDKAGDTTRNNAGDNISPETSNEAGDLAGLFLDNNQQFHDIVNDTGGNQSIRNAIRAVTPPPIVRRTAHVFDRKRIAESNDHHRSLVAAFAVKDSTLAEAVMRTHILAAASSYEKYYAE
ncbi:MAG: GntR family transcriptional regulator [Alphaproteobacteria bacterium]|nr:GntR family transcriptional regulator [Alphaproteobacteria bacterium]